jgi:hypothetical protein
MGWGASRVFPARLASRESTQPLNAAPALSQVTVIPSVGNQIVRCSIGWLIPLHRLDHPRLVGEGGIKSHEWAGCVSNDRPRSECPLEASSAITGDAGLRMRKVPP